MAHPGAHVREAEIVQQARDRALVILHPEAVPDTGDLDAKFERASTAPKVTVIRPPTHRTYPSYDGTSRIPVLSSILIDPDGHVVELNDLLIEPSEM